MVRLLDLPRFLASLDVCAEMLDVLRREPARPLSVKKPCGCVYPAKVERPVLVGDISRGLEELVERHGIAS